MRERNKTWVRKEPSHNFNGKWYSKQALWNGAPRRRGAGKSNRRDATDVLLFRGGERERENLEVT